MSGLASVWRLADGLGTTKYAYAAGGQLWTEDGPWSNDTVTNLYNNRLRIALGLAQPTGRWTNTFGYDAAKRLTNVTSPAGSFGYTLGAAGAASPLVKKLTLPNTSYITNVYDGNARLVSTTLKNSSSTILNSHSYLYNSGNQRTQQVFNAGSTYNYTYDPISQLKVADSATASEDRGYNYDAAGNLNYRTNNGTLQTFIVDGLNQLTNASSANYQYDLNGNMTNAAGITYAFDDENRLTLVSDDVGHAYRVGYSYDGLGRLRARQRYQWIAGPNIWTATVQDRYLYDGWRVIQDRIGDSTLINSYTRGTDLSGSLEGAGGIGGLLGLSQGYSGGNWSTHYCYHADGNGNITYLVNSSQTVAASYRYDAYGNTLSSSGTLAGANTYRFSSKEVDANTGLYYYGYRWYAPNLQRWLNQDPIMEEGGLNLYEFVANNPISLIDIFGLSGSKPGGPYHPPTGVSLSCDPSDSCGRMNAKMTVLMRMIRSHTGWDRNMPPPRGGGRHAEEIADLWRAVAKCQALYATKGCKDPKPLSFRDRVLCKVPGSDKAWERAAIVSGVVGGLAGIGAITLVTGGAAIPVLAPAL